MNETERMNSLNSRFLAIEDFHSVMQSFKHSFILVLLRIMNRTNDCAKITQVKQVLQLSLLIEVDVLNFLE